MDWLGIGVFILSIGFAVLVLILIPVMKKLTETLGHTANTVATVNKSIGEVTGETTVILFNANETLVDVNSKVTKLNPLFDIIHDTGKSAHHLTTTMARYTSGKADSAQTSAEILDKNNIEGILRGAAFIYYLRKAKQEFSKTN
ncbi:DUF948 domain-containing protein [Salipaludibacillus sp. HK11]|uniref:DUF948 domain-containing protein n=1 Tax=Salipaludibacillus sp. HK11 TaxID=3394320 RepID=UPI0039FDACD0